MVTITSGLVGGLLGAIVTGVAESAVGDGPSPSATVWAMYFGDGDPSSYGIQGSVVHLLYGAAAGAAFAGFARSLALDLSTVSETLVWALVWAGALAVIAVGFWSAVAIGEDTDLRSIAETAAVHVGYGVVLGVVAFFAAGL